MTAIAESGDIAPVGNTAARVAAPTGARATGGPAGPSTDRTARLVRKKRRAPRVRVVCCARDRSRVIAVHMARIVRTASPRFSATSARSVDLTITARTTMSAKGGRVE